MKTNLVKILALGGIALSLTACPAAAKKPVERTLAEVFSIVNGKLEFEGEYVKVDAQCVYGNFGSTYVIGAPYVEGGDIRNLKGFEAELKEVPEWKGETLGRYANVNVIGTIADVNGRPVLKDAKLEVNAEAQYDENGDRIDDDGAYSAGYWGPNLFKRSYFDEYMGKNMSGTLIEGYFQLASLPGTVSASAESSFKVVFPGENLDLEDEENSSLINVVIPAGLSEEVVTKMNTFFGSVNVGDGADMMGITRWDSSKGGMNILLENWWGHRAKKKALEIYSSWEEMAAEYNSYYNSEMVDLSAADENDSLGLPFSFVVDDESYLEDPRELWVEAYRDRLVTVTDPEACGTIKITANFRPSDFEAYITALESKLVSLSFTEDDAWNDEGFIVFSRPGLGDTVVEEVMLMAASESSLEIYYTAPRIVTDADFATFAAAKSAYEAEASGLLSALFSSSISFTSSLPAFPSAEAVTNINFSWLYETAFLGYYSQVGLILEFDFTVTLAEGVSAQTAGAAYISALTGAGFVQGTCPSLFNGTWFLGTTGEMVNLGLTEDGGLALTVMILDSTSSAFFVPAE